MDDLAYNLSCAFLRIPAATDERINQRIREAMERDAVKPKREAKPLHPQADLVLNWLNQKAGTKFAKVASNLNLVSQRLHEQGVTGQGCSEMIDRMCKLWGSDPKMRQYLRPETLFNATKFQSYYAQRNDPLPGEQVDQVARDKQAANLREKMRYSQGTERQALLAEIQRLEGGVR